MNAKTKNEIRKEKVIARMIEKELSYTNGWSISNDDYHKHCINIAKKIIQKLEQRENELVNKVFDWIWGRWNLDFSNIDKAKKDFIDSLTKE